MALVGEFKGQVEASRQRVPRRTVAWTPPRKDWYKVNVDMARFLKSRETVV